MKEIRERSQDPGVLLVRAGQCQFGLKTKSNDGTGLQEPAKKPTGFLTNTQAIATKLNRQCKGGHYHGWLLGGRAAGTARYHDGLCEAGCEGV